MGGGPTWIGGEPLIQPRLSHLTYGTGTLPGGGPVPFLATKIVPARFRGLVARPRLLAIVRTHAEQNSRNSIPNMSLPPTSPRSAGEIYPCKVDELGRPAIENRLHRVHPKMVGLIQCRPGRHGKLLSSTHHVDENRPLVRKRCLDGALQLLRLFNPDAADTHGFRH